VTLLSDRLKARLQDGGNAPDYARLTEEVLGIRGASGELARRLVMQALVIGDRREAWRAAGARIVRDAPAAPGVYVFRGDDDRALYVGKAINVRRRMQSHFAEHRWRRLKPEMARVERAEFHLVGSELEALLLEATLIRDLRPAVNIQTGPPAWQRRELPSSIADTLVLLPSSAADSIEVVAARVSGEWRQHTVVRLDDALGIVDELWTFFESASSGDVDSADRLAPIVFSWLRGRGASATRLDPHAAGSAAVLRHRLSLLLRDPLLFADRVEQWGQPG
jgi:hypothetical protein